MRKPTDKPLHVWMLIEHPEYGPQIGYWTRSLDPPFKKVPVFPPPVPIHENDGKCIFCFSPQDSDIGKMSLTFENTKLELLGKSYLHANGKIVCNEDGLRELHIFYSKTDTIVLEVDDTVEEETQLAQVN